MRNLLKRRELIPTLLVFIVFVVASRTSTHFLDTGYLLDKTTIYAETGFMALAMTLVIVTGNIDLSVASTLALVACLAALMSGKGWSPWLVGPASLVIGLLLGAVNGYLVAYRKLPSFVVTLATMAAYRGIAHAILGAQSAKVPSKLTGIDMMTVPHTPVPISLALFLVAAVIFGLLLHRTVFGRWVFATGTNSRAALLSGVPTQRITLSVFALSGLMAAIAALHIDSRLTVARFDHAQGLELDVITAVVLGGTNINGGQGTILGTVIALLLVALIRTGMGVANVTAEYQLAIIGTLLVLTFIATNAIEALASRVKTKHSAKED